MDFEIKYKDAMARIGTFETPHGKVTTPNLMPVVHPGKQTLDVKKFGAEIVITNSYIIYKNEKLKEKALKDGVHELINFPGTIETDSGSFQLSVYGDIDINNEEVIKFQEAIGTDIGGSATPIGASANVVGTSVAAKNGYPIGWGKYCAKLAPATVIVLALSTAYIFVRYL